MCDGNHLWRATLVCCMGVVEGRGCAHLVQLYRGRGITCAQQARVRICCVCICHLRRCRHASPHLTLPHFQIFQLSIGLAEASLFARLDAAVAFWACSIPDAGAVLCGPCVAITSPAGWKGRKAMLFARLRALSWVDASAHNTTVQLSYVSVVQQVVLRRAPP